MRRAIAAVLLMLLGGCGPSDEQVAQQCGVSVEDVKRTKSAVEAMQPYAGAELGKCSVVKVDSGVEVIPPEVKRNADLMVKEEAILNGIADRCGTSRDVWRVVSADLVQFVPGGINSDQKDCLLSEFHKAKMPVELDIVGSEHDEEKSQ